MSDAMTIARRNCELRWAIGEIASAMSSVNHAISHDLDAPPIARIEADEAMAAADKLESMAADLRAMAARRLAPLIPEGVE